ncbi:uncharacterized protein LOC126456641 [Schistocerca serialis cubense]|uniref:uncharacterized protein LOC126456641 n=1 Tax=Schistocerca serialis cubense TaxID=2023355 RepID=UPI00214DFA52|nr:uncharacterized protein LOC126456641 [Schistocerca serialis cubense]
MNSEKKVSSQTSAPAFRQTGPHTNAPCSPRGRRQAESLRLPSSRSFLTLFAFLCEASRRCRIAPALDRSRGKARAANGDSRRRQRPCFAQREEKRRRRKARRAHGRPRAHARQEGGKMWRSAIVHEPHVLVRWRWRLLWRRRVCALRAALQRGRRLPVTPEDAAAAEATGAVGAEAVARAEAAKAPAGVWLLLCGRCAPACPRLHGGHLFPN